MARDKAFDHVVEEDAALERMGYQQGTHADLNVVVWLPSNL